MLYVIFHVNWACNKYSFIYCIEVNTEFCSSTSVCNALHGIKQQASCISSRLEDTVADCPNQSKEGCLCFQVI